MISDRQSRLHVLGMLAVLATALNGSSGVLGQAAWQLEPQIDRLPNGLRVVVLEDHALPLVSVQVWYGAGSSYDDPANPGTCEVARRVLQHRVKAVADPAAAGGSLFCSRTLRDGTCFSWIIRPAQLDDVLRIESLRLVPQPVTTEMLATAAAQAPRTARCDLAIEDGLTLDENVAQRLCEALFPDHPYRNAPGRIAARPDTAELSEFLSRWFVPGNATVLIIGDVSRITAADAVRRAFGALPWAEPPRRAYFELAPEVLVRAEAAAPGRAGLVLAWRTRRRGAYQNSAVDALLNHLLNPEDGPLARRLASLGFTRLQWEQQNWSESGVALLAIDIEDARDRDHVEQAAAAVFAAVEAELTAATERVPDEVAWNRARMLTARDILERRLTFAQRARELAADELVGGDMLLYEFLLPGIERMPVADLQTAAKDLLETRRLVLILRPPAERPAVSDVGPLRPGREESNSRSRSANLLLPPTPEPAGGSGTGIAQVKPAPGASLALVEVTRVGPAATAAVAPGAAGATGVFPRELLGDYLTYHGLSMRAAAVPGLSTATLTGPPGELPQMIELGLRQVEAPGGAGFAGRCRSPVLVRVIADLPPQVALQKVRETVRLSGAVHAAESRE